MENKIIIDRIFNAPVDLVWQAWTTAENIAKWWGPKGFDTTVKELDFRPGGKWEFVMIDADGNKYPAIGVFKEIVKHKKITSTDEFGDEPYVSSNPDFPKVKLFTTLFEELGDKTKLTLIYDHQSDEDREKHVKMGVVGGWNTSLDKLEHYVKTGLNIRKQLKTNNAARVSTYLNFPGNTEEAFNFYKSIFGGEFSGNGIQRFGDIPAQEGQPPMSEEDKKLIIHVELQILGGHYIMATDAPESMGFTVTQGNNMIINLEPETKEETKRLYEALTKDGNITMELQDMFWGAYFGTCTDKFGINWMFNYSEK